MCRREREGSYSIRSWLSTCTHDCSISKSYLDKLNLSGGKFDLESEASILLWSRQLLPSPCLFSLQDKREFMPLMCGHTQDKLVVFFSIFWWRENRSAHLLLLLVLMLLQQYTLKVRTTATMMGQVKLIRKYSYNLTTKSPTSYTHKFYFVLNKMYSAAAGTGSIRPQRAIVIVHYSPGLGPRLSYLRSVANDPLRTFHCTRSTN